MGFKINSETLDYKLARIRAWFEELGCDHVWITDRHDVSEQREEVIRICKRCARLERFTRRRKAV